MAFVFVHCRNAFHSSCTQFSGRRKAESMNDSEASQSGLTFTLDDEDHTLANALRFMLNKK